MGIIILIYDIFLKLTSVRGDKVVAGRSEISLVNTVEGA